MLGRWLRIFFESALERGFCYKLHCLFVDDVRCWLDDLELQVDVVLIFVLCC